MTLLSPFEIILNTNNAIRKVKVVGPFIPAFTNQTTAKRDSRINI